MCEKRLFAVGWFLHKKKHSQKKSDVTSAREQTASWQGPFIEWIAENGATSRQECASWKHPRNSSK